MSIRSNVRKYPRETAKPRLESALQKGVALPSEPAFTRIPLDRGVTLHHRRSDRFKTELLRVFLRAPIDQNRTLRHLFAALLTRGTSGSPTRRALSARLQGLYGAGYGAAAQRIAGRHVLALRASTVAGRYLPGRPKNLKSLLGFLSEVLEGPAVESSGGVSVDVFEQERRNLLRDLAARFNNKGRYALDRLHEEMFAGHILADPDVGTAADVEAATPEAAMAEGMRVFSEGEADVYLLAPCTPGEAERLVRRHLKLGPRSKERFAPPSAPQARRRARRVSEQQDIEQGKLVMGFLFDDWSFGESPLTALLGDAILGSGAASKLFRNVREKRSLCYDVRSWIDPVIGTLGISAGIKPENYEAAVRAIRAEVRAMVAGRIDEAEVTSARRAIVSALRGVPDSQPGLVEFYYRRMLMKRRSSSLDAIIRSVERAPIDPIPELFERARLDTVFFLDKQEVADATA